MATSMLDDRAQIATLDTEGVLGSIEQLPDQIEQTWKESSRLHVDPSYKQVRRIVVSGMGGSTLGAHVIKSLYKSELTVPLEIVNHYELPGYVNEQALVVLSSYSGTTEETLASAEQAERMGAKIAVITAGGGLKQLAQSKQLPMFLIDPHHNPSNQPRMAIGYSVFGQLGLFHALGLLQIQDDEVDGVVRLLRKNAVGLGVESRESNTAKFLAYAFVDSLIVLVAAEHLEGAVHVFNNQINENAKNMTAQLTLPELNHHFMEGLTHPKIAKDAVRFLFVQSALYHPRVQARFPLTQEVVQNADFSSETLLAVSQTKLQQVWEVIQVGAYMNFYLAMLNGLNPAPIPTVDWFKTKLGAVSAH